MIYEAGATRRMVGHTKRSTAAVGAQLVSLCLVCVRCERVNVHEIAIIA